MAVRIGDDSMEKVERMVGGVAKGTGKVAADVVGDVKESLGLETLQSLPTEQQTVIKREDEARSRVIRRNIKLMDREIDEIRRKRKQQEQQQAQVQTQRREQKKTEKKRGESVLEKLLKSREGTKEGIQRVSG